MAEAKLRKHFPSLSKDEKVLEDCSCAYAESTHGVPQQGHLWVTEHYLCFHAKILSRKTLIQLRLEDVKSMEKQNTAYVVPNAMLLVTKENKKYFFTSLMRRDHTFGIIQKQVYGDNIPEESSTPTPSASTLRSSSESIKVEDENAKREAERLRREAEKRREEAEKQEAEERRKMEERRKKEADAARRYEEQLKLEEARRAQEEEERRNAERLRQEEEERKAAEAKRAREQEEREREAAASAREEEARPKPAAAAPPAAEKQARPVITTAKPTAIHHEGPLDEILHKYQASLIVFVLLLSFVLWSLL